MAYIGNAYSKKYITTTSTTLVATGQGVLHSVTFNKPVATGTVELDDALTQTNPFAIVTTATGAQPLTLIYDTVFQTGLSVTTGTAAQDITISYNLF